MKTSVRTRFLNKEHEYRFNQLVAYNQNYESENNLAACGYLLSANPHVFKKVMKYWERTMVNWEVLMMKEYLNNTEVIIINFAYQLYCGQDLPGVIDITLAQLTFLDVDMVRAFLMAIQLYVDFDNLVEQDKKRD